MDGTIKREGWGCNLGDFVLKVGILLSFRSAGDSYAQIARLVTLRMSNSSQTTDVKLQSDCSCQTPVRLLMSSLF